MYHRIFLAFFGVTTTQSSCVEIPLKQIPSMSGYNITSSMLFLGPSYKSMTSLGCAVQCSQSDSCLSYFYNSNTKQCQFHMEVFLDASGAETQPGTEYFYKQKNDQTTTNTSPTTTTTTPTTPTTTTTSTTIPTTTTTSTTTPLTTTTPTTPSTTTTATTPTTTTTSTTTPTTTTTTSTNTPTTTTTPTTPTTTTTSTTTPLTTTTPTTPSSTTTPTTLTTTTSTITTMITPFSCPTKLGFQVLGSDEMCVKFHTDLKTWSKANTVCESYSPNGHLVVVDTETKNNLVREAGKVINSQFATGVFIGLSMAEDWVDGSPLLYKARDNFSFKSEEECATYVRQSDWAWSTTHCLNNKHYICQISF